MTYIADTALSPATILVSTLFSAPLRTRRRGAIQIAAPIIEQLLERPSAIALVEGPSGSGKSTLVRYISKHSRLYGLRMFKPDRGDTRQRTRAIDHLCDILTGLSNSVALNILKSAVELLTICGLGEPALWLRRACTLSDSEQARFTIACTIARADALRAQTPYLIVIDEFLSTLDRITAQATARAISRLSHSCPSMRLLVATAHTDLASYLEPTLVIRRREGGAA